MASRRLIPGLLAALLAGCAAKAPAPAAATKPKPKPPVVVAVAAAAPTPSKPVAELLKMGQRAYDAGDFAAAVRAFELVIAADSANRTALWHLALMAERQAGGLPRPQSSPYYLRSAVMLRRLRTSYPNLTAQEREALPGILYNEACTLALYGESARAVDALADSINAGFVNIAQIEADPELDSLRGLVGFQNVMRRLETWFARVMLTASKPFPFAFALNDLNGKAVARSDFRGKVLVVVFWGTWCPEARKLVPHLAELYRRYQNQGLEIIALAYEAESGEGARKTVSAFARGAGIPYPCLIGDDATRNQVPGFAGYPTTLFLDRSGTVRLGLSGYQPLTALDAVASALLVEGQKETKKEKEQEKEKKPVGDHSAKALP